MTHLSSSRKDLGKIRWLALSLALTLSVSQVSAQQPKPGQDPPPPAADQPEAATPPADDARPTEEQESKLEERFEDPKAQAILENNFPELYQSARATRADTDRLIEAMASNQQPVDKASIDPYVQFQISQITSKRNIAAMLAPDAAPTAVKALEQGGQHLTRPLVLANASNNTEFRSLYTQAILKYAPEVLKGQLYSRIMLMVALSRSGDPASIPFLSAVLDDLQQPLAVQMLAAIGLTKIADNGKTDVVPANGIRASKSLANFLENDTSNFWPAQYRAIQAIGSIRQPGTDALKPDANLAATVLSFLANPEAHPTVRAWAAWALGMMRPNTQTNPYNFTLIANHIGSATAQNAIKILETDATNPQRSARLSALMLQFVTAFEGDPQARNSGILQNTHPSLAGQRQAVQAIADRVKGVARAAVELSRSVGTQREPRRSDLRLAVAELLGYLQKNPPTDATLYNNSPAFPPQLPEVPGAAGPPGSEATVGSASS